MENAKSHRELFNNGFLSFVGEYVFWEEKRFGFFSGLNSLWGKSMSKMECSNIKQSQCVLWAFCGPKLPKRLRVRIFWPKSRVKKLWPQEMSGLCKITRDPEDGARASNTAQFVFRPIGVSLWEMEKHTWQTNKVIKTQWPELVQSNCWFKRFKKYSKFWGLGFFIYVLRS